MSADVRVVDGRRLGGVFVAGDKVLVHYDDGSTGEGVVRSVMGGWVEVDLDGGVRGEFRPDSLWLVEP